MANGFSAAPPAHPPVASAAAASLVSRQPEGTSTTDAVVAAAARILASRQRTLVTSRSASRVPLAPRVPRAAGRLWSTADLNLRVVPRPQSAVKGLLPGTRHVDVTGRRAGAYAEVIVGGVSRWVTADYLSKDRPSAQPGSKGLLDRPCAGTEATENGLTAAAVKVYRAVCNNFPQITTYGGYDPHGEHASGKAIDIMTSDLTLGNAIADFLQANASALNIFDVIWQQRIWTPVRASEGRRSMPDRGSPTANHLDHVHVSVN